MSIFVIERTALAMRWQAVLQIPIGCTPEHLSREINLQAIKEEMPIESTNSEQRCFVTPARNLQREVENDMKAMHNRCHE